jgi:hypothetical protein
MYKEEFKTIVYSMTHRRQQIVFLDIVRLIYRQKLLMRERHAGEMRQQARHGLKKS